MKKNDKPSNMSVAIYLANNHREHMKSDEEFKKVATFFNMKWRVLKANFEAICCINDIFGGQGKTCVTNCSRDIINNEHKFKEVNIGVINKFDPLTIGVYCKLITSGKELVCNIKSLAKALGISDEKARTAIALLEREGYIKRMPLKNENGKFNGYAYEVETEPLDEKERSHAGTGHSKTED